LSGQTTIWVHNASRGVSVQKPRIRFEAVKFDPFFEVLDAVAFVDGPTTNAIAQYANIDGRTAGKLLKNARLIGLVQSPDDETYVWGSRTPHKGTADEKRKVVREALLRLPLIPNIRQFMALGNDLQDAMRKAATVIGEQDYDKSAIVPLIHGRIPWLRCLIWACASRRW
jgi:hypothetical protein